MNNKGVMKAVAATLAAAMLLATTACGGEKNDTASSTGASPSGSAAQSTQPGSASASEAPVEIVVWDYPTDGAANEVELPFFEREWKEFETKYPNIKVKHEQIAAGGKDREQYLTAMAGGNGPDAYPSNPFPDMEKYIANGFNADLTDRWNQYADKEQYADSVMAAATKDGKVYGIPHDIYIMAMTYNKKLFKGAGLDPASPPKTWDEFVAAAQKLTDPAKGTYGFNILGMDWADWHFEYWVWAAGGDLTQKNPDGTATLTFTSDAAVKALQLYKDLKWKYKVVQKNVVQSYDENDKDFQTGHAGMIIGSPDGAIKNGVDINDLGVMTLPAGPSGKAYHQTGGAYWSINAHSSPDKQDAAWKYIMFMTSKSYYDDELAFIKESGAFPPLVNPRKDVDPSTVFENIPADMVAAYKQASENLHLEYFLKARLSKYVVTAIQSVLLDEKADPLTELQKQQDLAQKEVIDPYNAEVKK